MLVASNAWRKKMWLTKDKFNIVQLWEVKPEKYKGYFLGQRDVGYIFDGKNAPNITLEDSPVEVELKIKDKQR